MKQHPVIDARPEVLQDKLYDFWWDAEKLHSLELPTRTLTTKEFLWHLDLPYWKHEGKPFQLTPRQVMEASQLYEEQHERTLATDLRYPIIVREDPPNDRLLILDGVHRLLKAVIVGLSELQVAVFDDKLVPLIEHD